jgi:hypothetical protein
MEHCIDFVPYTKGDLFNTSDIRFEDKKMSIFIPDKQHKHKLLKVFQKIEKEVIKNENKKFAL